MRRALAFVVVAALGCSRSRTPAPALAEAGPSGSTEGGTASPALVEPPLPPGAVRVRPDTLRFSSARSAAEWLAAFDVAVLAVGESHAPRGAPAVPSATSRFTREMLPALAPTTGELLVELWASDPRCRATVARVAEAQRAVTGAQRAENQSEFVTLGTTAKALGVTPYLLRPSCEEYERVADAGDDDVAVMLELVARVTAKDALRFAARAADAGTRRRVVAYGGAMHNDRAPRPELARYAFGAAIEAEHAGRYLELDLVVPEFVAGGGPWEQQPFFARFREDGPPSAGVTVYRGHERAYTLVFARADVESGAPSGR